MADVPPDLEIRLERERGDPRAVARYVPQPITDVSDAQYNEPAAVQGHTPRSISQYNEDFVLLATVDGRLSARDRKSGKLKWELVTQDPAVRTTYHRANATRDAGMRPEDIDADDLIEWIVGPTEAGELYFFTPGKNGGRLEVRWSCCFGVLLQVLTAGTETGCYSEGYHPQHSIQACQRQQGLQWWEDDSHICDQC